MSLYTELQRLGINAASLGPIATSGVFERGGLIDFGQLRIHTVDRISDLEDYIARAEAMNWAGRAPSFEVTKRTQLATLKDLLARLPNVAPIGDIYGYGQQQLRQPEVDLKVSQESVDAVLGAGAPSSPGAPMLLLLGVGALAFFLLRRN